MGSQKHRIVAILNKECIQHFANRYIAAKDISYRGLLGAEYIYSETNKHFKVSLQIGGDYNVYNSLLSISAALRLGMTEEQIITALKRVSTVDGRLNVIKSDITVIIDYAHTEAAFESVLKSIQGAKGRAPLTVIFGAGGNRDRSKRPKMAEAAEKYADKSKQTAMIIV